MARPAQRYLARPLALPALSRFEQLFAEWAPWNVGYPPTPSPIPAVQVPAVTTTRSGREKRASMAIGPFFTTSPGHHSLAVRPTDRVILALQQYTISIAYDTISFEAILWDPDSALVVAKHSQIIGSVWLSIIDPLTVPGWLPSVVVDLVTSARTDVAGAGAGYLVAADLFEENEERSLAEMFRKYGTYIQKLARRRAGRRS